MFPKMDHKQQNSTTNLVIEPAFADSKHSQQRKRSLIRDLTIVLSCLSTLVCVCCAYLVLSPKDSAFDLGLANIEIRRIKEVLNAVVGALPHEKKQEVSIDHCL